MSIGDWERLRPEEMAELFDVWTKKQERENRKLEAVDVMAAQIAWAVMAPHMKPGASGSIADWRVLRSETESEERPSSDAGDKEAALIAHARLAHASAKRAKLKKQEKQHGKK